ncbi:MAG: hypothetical protein ACEPOV_02675 [Hyphomicrobiales bacterium]
MIKRFVVLTFCMGLLCFSCEKELQKVCPEGSLPRTSNVIYNAHFKTEVNISAKDLKAQDTIYLYIVDIKSPYNKEQTIVGKVYDSKINLSHIFQIGEKYLLQTAVEDEKYTYTYENLCP